MHNFYNFDFLESLGNLTCVEEMIVYNFISIGEINDFKQAKKNIDSFTFQSIHILMQVAKTDIVHSPVKDSFVLGAKIVICLE